MGPSFTFKGKELRTLGELVDGLGEVTTREEAREFRDAYRRVSEYADQNIAYMLGYFGPQEMFDLQRLFAEEQPQ